MSTAVCTTSTLSTLSLPNRNTAAAIPPAVRRGAWQIAPGEAMSLKARGESVRTAYLRQGNAIGTITGPSREQNSAGVSHG